MATTKKRAKELKAKGYMRNNTRSGRGVFGYTPLRASQRRGEGEVERSISNNQRNAQHAAAQYAASGDRGYRIAKNQAATDVRQLKKDISNPGNTYREGTKEELNAQHRSTYRDLRAAFGLTTG